MNKYIHIGYPKNFSTTLQRDFFPKHPELFHLGVGSADSNLGYRSGLVEDALEVYLKSCKKPKYREVRQRLKEGFQELFVQAGSMPDKKLVGISCEHLSFCFSNDGLDYVEKAKRLADLFGGETRIILIARNQIDLIRSLYRESIRQGLVLTYADYLDSLYKYQDRNFVYDFRFDDVFDLYADLFGEENVGLFFFENYKKPGASGLDVGGLCGDLSNFLGIEDPGLDFDHYNESLTGTQLSTLLGINRENRHNLGNHLLSTAEFHRIKHYWTGELKLEMTEAQIYADVLRKRENIKLAQEHEGDGTALSYDAPSHLTQWLLDFYRVSNERLRKRFPDLPDAYNL